MITFEQLRELGWPEDLATAAIEAMKESSQEILSISESTTSFTAPPTATSADAYTLLAPAFGAQAVLK